MLGLALSDSRAQVNNHAGTISELRKKKNHGNKHQGLHITSYMNLGLVSSSVKCAQ